MSRGPQRRAARLALSLASLRDLAMPGLAEMRGAALAALCHGDELALRLIERRLYVGETVGEIDESVPQAPLARDLALWQKKTRLKPEELCRFYRLDERLCAPRPSFIALCDDMLTTGCHYRAVQSVLTARFPEARFCGIFLARRAPQPPDFEAVEIDQT